MNQEIQLRGLPVVEQYSDGDSHRRLLARATNRLAQLAGGLGVGTLESTGVVAGKASWATVPGLDITLYSPVRAQALVRVEVGILGTGADSWNIRILVDGRVLRTSGLHAVANGEELIIAMTAPLFELGPTRARPVTVEFTSAAGTNGSVVAGSLLVYNIYPLGD